MSIESSGNAKEIFLAAIEIESGEERESFLLQECGSDEELRRRVNALLLAHERPESLLNEAAPKLEQSGVAPTIDHPVLERPGMQVGQYKLREKLGAGGMGVVWAADRKTPIRQRVALKLIKPGMDSEQVLARFEAEREALSLMDHPNIARVLDAGTTAQGRPYFVMELIRGVPITEYCDARKLSISERLRLFIQACKAVQHAHQKGIIHRDIKPSNVLVSEQDGEPLLKVIDFGVAKALHQPLTDRSVYSGVFQAIGTLAYMSPEQAGLSFADVDTRADIYGLGALLYELLTGQTPFDKDELASAALDEAFRIIREKEPLKPSTKITSLGDKTVTALLGRGATSQGLARALTGDLDWIVMTALDKDRGRRYETATSFAADIERFLRNEVISARPPSTLYRLRKVTNRHRVGIAAAFLLLTCLTATSVSGMWAWLKSREIALQNEELRYVSVEALARAREAEGKFQEAVEHYEQLVELQTARTDISPEKQLDAQFRLALSLYGAERIDEAIDALRSVLSRQREKLGFNHLATNVTGTRLVSILIEQARLILDSPLQEERIDKALRYSEEAKSICEQQQIRLTEEILETLVDARFHNGDPKNALIVVNQWLDSPWKGSQFPIYAHLARCFGKLGELELGRDWLAAANESWTFTDDIENARWRKVRAEATRLLHGSSTFVHQELTVAEEEQLYTRLIEASPEAAVTRRFRGYCRIRLGDIEGGLEDFFRSVETDDGHVDPYYAASLATTALHSQDAEAIAVGKEILSRTTLADWHDAAQSTALMSILLDPQSKELPTPDEIPKQLNLPRGLAAYRMGQFKVAIEILDDEFDHRPARQASTLLIKAACSKQLGNDQLAQQYLGDARVIIDRKGPGSFSSSDCVSVGYATSVIWLEPLILLNEIASDF